MDLNTFIIIIIIIIIGVFCLTDDRLLAPKNPSASADPLQSFRTPK
jgi:hypothetical protein